MVVLFLLSYLLLFINNIEADPLTWLENENLQKTCGRIGNQPKTSEGNPVQPEEAPWTVGISYYMNAAADRPVLRCSGTLISRRHVLTAASCLLTKIETEGETNDNLSRADKKVEVILPIPSRFVFTFATSCSDHSGKKCQMRGDVLKRKGLRAWIPRKYLQQDVSNIAIIEMDSDIEFTDKIMPACFTDGSSPEISESLDHYGFGTTDHHKEDWGALQRLMRTVKSCLKAPELEDNPDQFCTRSDRYPCKNYLGGGLIRDSRGVQQIIGVMGNLGESCENRGQNEHKYQDLSVDVSHHFHWICKKTGICMGNIDDVSNIYSDQDVELITDKSTEVVGCEDQSWFYSAIGTEGLCFKPKIFGHGKELNISQVEGLCQQIEAFAAPIRNHKELQAANEALKFHWSDFKRARKDGLTVIGARRNAPSYDFRWTFDNSVVSHKPEFWEDEGANLMASEAEKKSKSCLALVWYPSINAPEQIRFKDVTCDSEETQAVLCAKPPKKEVRNTN